ncbi:type III CRISPR-associated RAMP protein Csx7 [Sorangium sp. So ce854]|uniref:type III CRISPR-associated RAMP protein Csx7 n=1 Tax=Sorangium sp. So ce854 TaxID=3133322 RepID=UPI003F648747
MSSSAADFHRLQQRLRLSGQLVTRTALRIGSGGSGQLDAADLPVLRDAEGYPLLPGGSLKGALRSTVEALVRGAELPPETGIWTCDPLRKRNESEGACGDHREGERAGVDVTRHCAVCRLLGSHVVASHVRFSDALVHVTPDDRVARRIPIEVRDGVAIDRDLRRQYGKNKYDFEVVSPGVRFDLEVFVENPQPWLMGLLVLGFDQFKEGFTALGGFTSRGLGRVDVGWHGMLRITARDLLEGRPGESLEGAALEEEFSSFRSALAERARGNA